MRLALRLKNLRGFFARLALLLVALQGAPAHAFESRCIRLGIDAHLESARTSPVLTLERDGEGYMINGYRAQPLVGSAETGTHKGNQTDSMYLYTDAEGVHHIVKILHPETSLEDEVRGALLHERLGGPTVLRVGKIAMRDGRTLSFIDRTEMFHGEQVFTLKGLAYSQRDLSVLYQGPESTRLTRQMARLLVHASEQGVSLVDLDFIFIGTEAQLLDPGSWTESVDAFRTNEEVWTEMFDRFGRDPLASAMLLSDYEKELRLSSSPDLSPPKISGAVFSLKRIFYAKLFKRAGLSTYLTASGVKIEWGAKLGSQGSFFARDQDVISAVDGASCVSADPVQMVKLFDGRPHRLTILRGGQTFEVTVDMPFVRP